jgi:hypothetical protein
MRRKPPRITAVIAKAVAPIQVSSNSVASSRDKNPSATKTAPIASMNIVRMLILLAR